MSQTLAPSPSAWTALLIALTNASMLGQLGAGAREQYHFPPGSSRHEEGDHGQGCGPGLRPGFAPSSCSKAQESPSTQPQAPVGARALEPSCQRGP